jgi:hypothetical protein
MKWLHREGTWAGLRHLIDSLNDAVNSWFRRLSLQTHPGLSPVSNEPAGAFPFQQDLVVVAIIVEVVVSSGAQIKASMVPMSVSLTDPNSDASDPDVDVFRDDNWLVANVQRAGKRRHR